MPPEVPLEQTQEEIAHHAHETTERWVMGVALTAALLAACAAINALVSEYYAVKAMDEQIRCADQWNYYQAKGIKAAVLSNKIDLRHVLGKETDPKDLDKLKRYRGGAGGDQRKGHRAANGLGPPPQPPQRRWPPA